ncbi:hypothetical protein LXM94_09115 [Rhizobium sp. TRM95111]|uniref:hypothetical protein n=1 Tax=Rhizobium alarense TaxID=2846851 RepID=UPI001F18F721|nr:hypothetical protein [Rhizobium alarense]MCF3640127.1 hypothetical protein [Rhizobium alarense]
MSGLKTGDIVAGEAFKHIKNNHKSCVVVFSAFAARNFGPNAFSFHSQFIQHVDKKDVLFIKDAKNQWYNKSLPGIGDGIEATTAWLRRTLAPYENIILFGQSMGGYASLLFGSRLNVDNIIALSPQTFLRSPYPRFNPKLHKGPYADLSEENYSGTKRIDVVIGEDDLFDIYQINTLPSDKVIKTIVPTAFHNVLYLWHRQENFDKVVAAVMDDTWPTLIDNWRETYRPRLQVAPFVDDPQFARDLIDFIENRYAGDKMAALNMLVRIQAYSNDWIGPTAAMGLLKMDMGATLEAIDLLDKVRSKSNTIDDIYRPLARALASQKHIQRALEVAEAGIKINVANRVVYRELEPIFYAYGLTDAVEMCRTLAAA